MAKITPDGRLLWSSGDLLEANNDCGVGLAAGKLFTLLCNAKVIAVDPASGRGLWKTTTDWHDPHNTWGPGSDVLSLAAGGNQVGIGNGIIHSGNSMDCFLVRHHGGRTYLANVNVEPRIVMVDEANHRLVPVVSSKYFLMHDFLNPAHTPRALVEAYFGGTIPEQPKFGGVPNAARREAVFWTDLNGDGIPQPGEMIFSPRKIMTWSCARMWLDDEMNIYTMSEQPLVWRPKGWTSGGAPLYGGWDDGQPLGERPKWFNPLRVSWPAGSGIVPLSDGSLVGFFNNTENPFGKGIGTDGIGSNYIVKWDADGLWVGRLLENPDLAAAPEQA